VIHQESFQTTKKEVNQVSKQKFQGTDELPTYLVQKLRELGLNKYEAQSYISLLKDSPSTARDVSQRTSVPKQRIYDILEALVAKGLVLVTHSKPRLYSAVPPKRAVNMLLEKARSIEMTANEVLYGLENIHTQHFRRKYPEKTVWVIIKKEEIQEKIRESIRGASQSLLVISKNKSLLHQFRYDILSAKTKGVDITILTDKVDHPMMREFSPLETDAELPNIFIFDDRQLAWVVTDEFMVYSECPLCAYEVIKSCKMIVQTAVT
jgi:sugar-specific transcriptional regulator TrmB